MPEEAGEEFASPFYARVVKAERDTVRFRSLEGGEGTIPRSVTEGRQVSASVVNKTSLCHRPVAAATVGKVHHGQVVGSAAKP